MRAQRLYCSLANRALPRYSFEFEEKVITKLPREERNIYLLYIFECSGCHQADGVPHFTSYCAGIVGKRSTASPTATPP